MKYAEGGHIQGWGNPAGPALKLTPGEHLFHYDGRIWLVTDDGERVELVAEPQEKDS